MRKIYVQKCKSYFNQPPCGFMVERLQHFSTIFDVTKNPKLRFSAWSTFSKAETIKENF